jgi:hypothetical protein
MAVNLAAFVATALSTLMAGAYLEGAPLGFPMDDPARLADGVPFAASLLGILAAHEFGHWFAARRYGLDVTLPFFIPLPLLSPIGTLGAVIKMKTPIYTRRMLLDVGAAAWRDSRRDPGDDLGSGALPVLEHEPGAGSSRRAAPVPGDRGAVRAPVPEGRELYSERRVQRLDRSPGHRAEHASRGAARRRAAWCTRCSAGGSAIGWLFFVAILVMGWWWPGWYVWGALILFLIRIRHPAVLDPH